MIVLFDVLGTLFAFDEVREVFLEHDIDPGIAALWLDKFFESAMTATLAGQYLPFDVLARSTVLQTLAAHHIDPRPAAEMAEALYELRLRPEARECMNLLRSDGHRLAVFSNADSGRIDRMLARAGLKGVFERIYCSDSVKACRPHPALYEMLFCTQFAAPFESCLVSVHEWDVLGAASVGMHAVLIDRTGADSRLPGEPAGFVLSNLSEVPDFIAHKFGRVPDRTASNVQGSNGSDGRNPGKDSRADHL